MENEKKLQKKSISLTVAGVGLNLLTDESDDYMKELAEAVTKKITDRVMGNARTNKIDAALICALEYLDDVNKQKADIAKEHERAEIFYRELCLLKQENAELKTLLGGVSEAPENGNAEMETENG